MRRRTMVSSGSFGGSSLKLPTPARPPLPPPPEPAPAAANEPGPEPPLPPEPATPTNEVPAPLPPLPPGLPTRVLVQLGFRASGFQPLPQYLMLTSCHSFRSSFKRI